MLASRQGFLFLFFLSYSGQCLRYNEIYSPCVLNPLPFPVVLSHILDNWGVFIVWMPWNVLSSVQSVVRIMVLTSFQKPSSYAQQHPLPTSSQQCVAHLFS